MQEPSICESVSDSQHTSCTMGRTDFDLLHMVKWKVTQKNMPCPAKGQPSKARMLLEWSQAWPNPKPWQNPGSEMRSGSCNDPGVS